MKPTTRNRRKRMINARVTGMTAAEAAVVVAETVGAAVAKVAKTKVAEETAKQMKNRE